MNEPRVFIKSLIFTMSLKKLLRARKCNSELHDQLNQLSHHHTEPEMHKFNIMIRYEKDGI